MLKLLFVMALSFALSSRAHAARNGNGSDSGENPCQSVANTCSVSGFEGKDIWTKCVEPLKRGKKVVTSDGTVVAPDVPVACKTGKPANAEGGHHHHGGDDSTSAAPAPSDSGSTPAKKSGDAATPDKPTQN